MKKAMIDFMKGAKSDELYTPEYAVTPLLKYVPKHWRVWECTDHGNSNITKVFREAGHTVVTSHIDSGGNFLNTQVECDIIITNPPYSLKTEFLRRAYELRTPFAFLLPITALETRARGQLFKYGLEILVFDNRVNFMKTKKAVWFNTSWFCWNVLPRTLIFHQLEGE